MQKTTMWALLLAPVLGPAIWYGLLLPGRLAARAVWLYMPEGRLRRLLLDHNQVLEPGAVWPRLPPGP